MTRGPLPLFVALALVAGAALPARASQPPAPAVTTAVDADATCMIAVSMAGARFGNDPSFMGAQHDQAVAGLRDAMFFYAGRLSLHYPGDALDRTIVAADNALPRDRWMGVSATCMDDFSPAVPGLGRELNQALEAAGVRRDGPQPAPTPADAASLDPDLRCVAIFIHARRVIAGQGAGATANETAALPRLVTGTVFYTSRALARLPAATRGALFATTLRSIREDQRTDIFRQCASRMSAEMARISRAAAAAGAQETASPHPTGQ